MKKLISVLLTLICLCTFLGIQCFAAEKTDPNYLYLRSCGYPDSFLDEVSADYLAKTVEAIGDSAVSEVKIREGATYTANEPNERCANYTTYTAELKDRNSGRTVGQLLHVVWEWNKLPLFRGEETILFGWNKDDFLPEKPFYLEQYSKDKAEDKWNVVYTHAPEKVRMTHAAQGEGGMDVRMPKSGKYLGGALLLKLEVTDSTQESYDTQVSVSHSYIVNFWRDCAAIYIPFTILLIAAIIVIVKVRKKKKQEKERIPEQTQ